jgi:hypothetical protein
MQIVAKAPCRVDLAGGTLDIWPLYLHHANACTVDCGGPLYDVRPADPGGRADCAAVANLMREGFPALEALPGGRTVPVGAARRGGAVFCSADGREE